MRHPDPNSFRRLLLPLAGALGMILPINGIAERQPAADDTQPVTRERPKPGFHAADFRFRPSLSLTQRYDSNVFITERDQKSDWITVLSPRLKIDSTWARHSLALDGGAEIGQHNHFSGEDYLDHWTDASGHVDIGVHSRLHLGLGAARDHEERDSPDERRGGLEPTLYRRRHANVGLTTHGLDTAHRLGMTYEDLDFDDTPSADGMIVNDDRDRSQIGLAMRIEHPVDKGAQVFVQLQYDRRDYDLARDQNGFQRSSEGFRAAVGMKTDFTTGSEKGSSAEAYLGIISQDYDDSRFERLQTWDVGGRLKYTLDSGTRLTLELQRTLNETTVAGSPGLLSSRLTMGVELGSAQRLSSFVKLDYRLSDYLEVAREDEDLAFGAGAKYFLSPNVYLVTGATLTTRDSDGEASSLDAQDFRKELFYIGLTGQFYPL